MKSFRFEWDENSISSFWDMYSDNFGFCYFSKKFGKDLTDFVEKNLKIQGDVLDFGCGPGFLLEKMACRKGLRLFGVDSSFENVRLTKERLSRYKAFGGCEKISHSFFSENSGKFMIFLIECIEHVMPSALSDYLKIRSLMKNCRKCVE